MIFLSVIIPTRNRVKHLSNALKSLTKQTYPVKMFEVLVIDNGSMDSTSEMCRSLRDRMPQLQYFYVEKPGLHVGRHLGMKKAQSKILVYADDDIEAFPTWLEAIAESFENPEVVLVGGKILPKFSIPPPDWVLLMWGENQKGQKILGNLSLLDLGDDVSEIDPSCVYGCNFSIRKSVLTEAGGFHPDAMPMELIRYRGDGESHVSRFIERMGYKAIYHPKASVYHVIPAERLTESYFCERSFFQGISDSYSFLRKGVNLSSSAVRRNINWLKFFSFRRKIWLDSRQRRMMNAHRRGFLMHQKEAYHDHILYRWIMKEHYLDE